MADISFTKPTNVNGSVPAISAANLQARDDALDAVCHLANRGAAILDASTVSGYGIGAVPSQNTNDLNAIVNPGNYYCPYNAANHFPVGNNGMLVVTPTNSTNYSKQTFTAAGAIGVVFEREFSAGSPLTSASTDANGWYKVWNATNDGNGGQPPAAKSNRTSNTTIGWIDSVDCASGGTVTLPTGGTFETMVVTYGATYNGVKCAIVAGGAMSGTASANLVMSYKRLS